MRPSMRRFPHCRRKRDERVHTLLRSYPERGRRARQFRTPIFLRGNGNKKAPGRTGGLLGSVLPRLNAGASRDEALAARCGGWQLNGERDLAPVSQNAQLDGPVLIIALC